MSRLCFPLPPATALACTLLLVAPLAGAGDNAWSELPSPSVNGSKVMVYKLINSPTSGSIRFAGTSSGVFKSNNGGATWSASNSGITPSPAGYLFINDMVVDPGNGSTLYITPNFQQKSTDAGATWARTGWDTENPQALLLAIDPLSPSTVWTAANRGIYKTTNGGATWTYVTGTIASSALTIDPSNPSVLYRAVSGSGIFKTSNGGISWDTVNTGLTSLYVVSVAVDPTNSAIVYAGTSGSGVFKSSNGGSTWTASNTTYPHNGSAVYLSNKWISTFLFDPANSAIVYVGTGAGIYRSQDGGAHWSEANNGAMANINTMVFDPASPSTIISGNNYGLFSYSYPTDADRVFNWAESLLGVYFPPGAKTQITSGISLRYYASTDIFLGTIDGVLYVYGSAFGGLRAVGSLASFLEAATAAGF